MLKLSNSSGETNIIMFFKTFQYSKGDSKTDPRFREKQTAFEPDKSFNKKNPERLIKNINFFFTTFYFIFLLSIVSAQNEPGSLLTKGHKIASSLIIKNADTAAVTFIEKNKIIKLEGNVELKYNQLNLKSEEFNFNEISHTLTSPVNIKLDHNGILMTAKSMQYNLKARYGHLNYPVISFSPWIIKGSRIKLDESNKYKLFNISLTTCDQEKPHYLIKSKRAVLKNNDRIYLYHPVIYLYKVPVFYFPFLTKSLKKRRLEITPKYSKKNGFIISTKYNLLIKNFHKSSLLVDYYKKRGVAGGFEGNYNSDNTYVDLFGYIIDSKQENGSNRFHKQRWNIASRISSVFYKDIQLSSKLDISSDSTFKNDFKLSGDYRVSEIEDVEVGLDRLKKRYLWRVYFDRENYWDTVKNKFELNYQDFPKLKIYFQDYTLLAGKKIVYVKPSLTYARMKRKNVKYDEDKFNFELFFSKRLFNRYGNTLSAGVGYIYEWDLKTDSVSDTTSNENFYKIKLNYTNQIFRNITINSTFFYVKGDHDSIPDTFNYNGVKEKKAVCAIDYYSGKFTGYITTGYDFRRYAGEKVEHTKIKYFPLHFSSHLDLYKNNFFTDIFYNIYEEEINNFTIGHEYSAGKDKFGFSNTFGYLFRKNDTNFSQLSSTVNFPVSLWSFKYSQVWDFNLKKIKENSINIYRDLHCMETSIEYRKTTTDKYEFKLMFNIKGLK